MGDKIMAKKQSGKAKKDNHLPDPVLRSAEPQQMFTAEGTVDPDSPIYPLVQKTQQAVAVATLAGDRLRAANAERAAAQEAVYAAVDAHGKAQRELYGHLGTSLGVLLPLSDVFYERQFWPSPWVMEPTRTWSWRRFRFVDSPAKGSIAHRMETRP